MISPSFRVLPSPVENAASARSSDSTLRPRRVMAALSDDVDTWAQCDRCSKWRLLPASAFPLAAQWYCTMNTATREHGHAWSCAVPEVATEADEAELAGDGCFVVGGLLGKRKRGQGKREHVQYLVHWAGFTGLRCPQRAWPACA